MKYQDDDITIDVAEIAPYVALVEFTRPPHNFISLELIGLLVKALEEIDGDPHVRSIVLASSGKAFCAGADMTARGPAPPRGELYVQGLKIFAVSKPIIAVIQGAAVGGGLGLAMAADFRVAAPEARLSANFARLGFHQGFALSETLPRVAGPQFALEMLLTGRRIGGEEAFRHGLVDRLVPLSETRSTAVSFAEEIAQSAPLALTSIRRTLKGGLEGRLKSAIEVEIAEQERLRATDDFREGVRAMAERRPPMFQGR